MGLSQPNQSPASWPEVHRSCRMGMSVFVRPGLHLAEWTRHIMEPFYFVDAHRMHSSGCMLPLHRSSVSFEFQLYMTWSQHLECFNTL